MTESTPSPLAPTNALPLPPAEATAYAPPGILIVDDERLVREMLQTILSRRGFTVWSAETGQDALDLYRRHQGRIAVVLLDVRMPGLDGPQTLAELRRLDPGVTCCFMSGQAADHSPDDLLAAGAFAFFAKPFAVREVAERLWQIAQQALRRSA